ncbi:MAG: hypothetical protein ACI9KN_000444 [Gammaproteobacteria bacterium]|jgi:hypothetical protein
MKQTLIAIVSLFLSFSIHAQEIAFDILDRDESIVTAVKTEGDNIWIKLTNGHSEDVITVRISDRNQDRYRSWFHGSPDLVSSGFRGNGTWSDRVQTSANFVEYWHEDRLVLHLERK